MPVNLINLVTDRTKTSQAALARKLNVSKVQISRWKNGEHIPRQRAEQLLAMLNMTDIEAEWSPYAKGAKEIETWILFLSKLQDDVFPLFKIGVYDMPILIPAILEDLRSFSVIIPPVPPIGDLDDDLEIDERSSFGRLLSAAIMGAGRLAFWVNKYATDSDDDVLADINLEMQHYCFQLALHHLDPLEFSECIEDVSVYRKRSLESWENAREVIDRWCSQSVATRTPITTNYFDILKIKPEILVDEEDAYGSIFPCISEYYTHTEQEMMHRHNFILNVVFELHRKVDCLLTTDMKDTLKPVLEITKPFFPYPPENRPS